MMNRMNELLDKLSDFLSRYPGLLPLIGILLVLLNLLLQFFPDTWLAMSNLLLHLGVIFSIIGILLIRPLG
jgi:hypothetical protein